MVANQSRLSKEMGRLRVITARYSQTFWLQALLTLLVVLTFVFCYMVIKFIPKRRDSYPEAPMTPRAKPSLLNFDDEF